MRGTLKKFGLGPLVVLIVVGPLIWWWWPKLGSEAKSFPGNRAVTSFLSQATGGSPVPDFEGAPVIGQPLAPLPQPPHPFQNNQGYSGAHADSYNSHAMPETGPLGHNPKVMSRMVGSLPTLCSTQNFDSKGRIVTMCVGLVGKSRLLLLDSKDLHILAETELPGTAGFYFRMDQNGRFMIPIGDLSLQLFEVVDGKKAPYFRRVARYDLAPFVPEEVRTKFSFPLDVVSDWQGNWWFTLFEPALFGYVDFEGHIHTKMFSGEVVENGLAADPHGVYVASNKYLYGFHAGPSGVAEIMKFPYESGKGENSLSKGTGTTPTIFGDRLIAFGDNADPRPNVLVYRLDDVPNEKRLICKVPVFKPGRSVLENSFIGYDHSLVIENNIGFSLTNGGHHAEPGFARIDVRKDLSGCDTIWENYSVRAATGPKFSLGSGLIYVHEPRMDTGWVSAWYVTAIDFRTGKTVWRKYVGSGKQWDNAMLTVSIGPDGTLTSGMFFGLLALRDGP